jgi:hypothetical protein
MAFDRGISLSRMFEFLIERAWNDGDTPFQPVSK